MALVEDMFLNRNSSYGFTKLAFILELNPLTFSVLTLLIGAYLSGKQAANMISALSSPQPAPQPFPVAVIALIGSSLKNLDKEKSCKWVTRKNLPWRCKNVIGTKEACPKTCTNSCKDNPGTFTLRSNGKDKRCAWAAINTEERCKKASARQNCAVTCGECS